MNCHICGTPLNQTVTDLPFKLEKKRIVIFKDLPVLQCDGCGDFLLEDTVMARVEEILDRANTETELEILRYAA
ncbi:MAG: YgiT-type zinc finger protein [Rectinemataceae bacterium]|nr:YgiT-type zinc finger protein [Rectinemataceae bacterium]